jgi:serine protease Do
MISTRFTRAGAIALFTAGQLSAAPPVIDDRELVKNLKMALEKAAGNGIPTADALAASAKSAPRIPSTIPLPAAPVEEPRNQYESLSRSVYLVQTIYKCGKCSHWHQGGSATAWCIGADGLMITNAHVFLSAKGGAMGVTDREGACHPVTELVGIDADSDVALFRVKATGLRALRLGETPDVGAPVTIISNPDGNLFLRTTGSVARYAKTARRHDKPKITWMNVTAEYAKGSSGGPVFNDAGEVVGMVSSTRSIHSGPGGATDKTKGDLQMVIRNCVPIAAIRGLFEVIPINQAKAQPER